MGRLPWLGPLFLRSRRLRARLDMTTPGIAYFANDSAGQCDTWLDRYRFAGSQDRSADVTEQTRAEPVDGVIAVTA